MRTWILALLASSAFGCKSYPNLEITEVGLHQVEIYLDEPADRSLSLRGLRLWYASSGGTSVVIPLGVGGELRGGEYVVVWESSSYQGPPANGRYTNYDNNLVKGIVVAAGTFPAPGVGEAFACRVFGDHRGFRVFIPVVEEIEDVVKFGAYDASVTPSSRPDVGGNTYTEDGSTAGLERTLPVGVAKAKTIQRRRMGSAFVNTNSEADLRLRDENFGSN